MLKVLKRTNLNACSIQTTGDIDFYMDPGESGVAGVTFVARREEVRLANLERSLMNPPTTKPTRRGKRSELCRPSPPESSRPANERKEAAYERNPYGDQNNNSDSDMSGDKIDKTAAVSDMAGKTGKMVLEKSEQVGEVSSNPASELRNPDSNTVVDADAAAGAAAAAAVIRQKQQMNNQQQSVARSTTLQQTDSNLMGGANDTDSDFVDANSRSEFDDPTPDTGARSSTDIPGSAAGVMGNNYDSGTNPAEVAMKPMVKVGKKAEKKRMLTELRARRRERRREKKTVERQNKSKRPPKSVRDFFQGSRYDWRDWDRGWDGAVHPPPSQLTRAEQERNRKQYEEKKEEAERQQKLIKLTGVDVNAEKGSLGEGKGKDGGSVGEGQATASKVSKHDKSFGFSVTKTNTDQLTNTLLDFDDREYDEREKFSTKKPTNTLLDFDNSDNDERKARERTPRRKEESPVTTQSKSADTPSSRFAQTAAISGAAKNETPGGSTSDPSVNHIASTSSTSKKPAEQPIDRDVPTGDEKSLSLKSQNSQSVEVDPLNNEAAAKKKLKKLKAQRALLDDQILELEFVLQCYEEERLEAEEDGMDEQKDDDGHRSHDSHEAQDTEEEKGDKCDETGMGDEKGEVAHDGNYENEGYENDEWSWGDYDEEYENAGKAGYGRYDAETEKEDSEGDDDEFYDDEHEFYDQDEDDGFYDQHEEDGFYDHDGGDDNGDAGYANQDTNSKGGYLGEDEERGYSGELDEENEGDEFEDDNEGQDSKLGRTKLENSMDVVVKSDDEKNASDISSLDGGKRSEGGSMDDSDYISSLNGSSDRDASEDESEDSGNFVSSANAGNKKQTASATGSTNPYANARENRQAPPRSAKPRLQISHDGLHDPIHATDNFNSQVSCVAIMHNQHLFLYEDGRIATPRSLTGTNLRKKFRLSEDVFDKLQNLDNPATYVVLRAATRYYIKFRNGETLYEGPPELKATLSGKPPSDVRQVAFGDGLESWCVVYTDGSFKSSIALPPTLKQKLFLSGGQARVDVKQLSLGPSGEWFLACSDGTKWCNAASSSRIGDIARVETVTFGVMDSYIVIKSSNEGNSASADRNANPDLDNDISYNEEDDSFDSNSDSEGADSSGDSDSGDEDADVRGSGSGSSGTDSSNSDPEGDDHNDGDDHVASKNRSDQHLPKEFQNRPPVAAAKLWKGLELHRDPSGLANHEHALANFTSRVTCVTLSQRNHLFIYDDGQVVANESFKHYGIKQLEHERLKHPDEIPTYLAIGSQKRFYLKYKSGFFRCKPRCLSATIMRNTSSDVRSVAFGSSSQSWFVVYDDGSFDYQNIPPELEQKLTVRRMRKDLDHVHLGPTGEWFLCCKNGKSWWDNVSTSQKLQGLRIPFYRVKTILFGSRGTLVVGRHRGHAPA